MNYFEKEQPCLFDSYQSFENSFDEYFQLNCIARDPLADIINPIRTMTLHELTKLHAQVRDEFRKKGITFKVYSNQESKDHVFPFDLIPRIITAQEWKKIESGLLQRITALNAFLIDIYGEQRIVKDNRVPRYLIASCPEYLSQLRYKLPKNRTSINIAGCDLIRDNDGEFYVLEDNLRVPSGVSYLLSNRQMMEEFLPDWMKGVLIHEVEPFSQHLMATLQSLASNSDEDPFVVVLTPGPYNSAYFEHRFLAGQMNCPLVENHELIVKDGFVYWRGATGEKKVDVIYRRTDDQFLDPTFFRKDSLLGVPGLVDAYFKGNVVLSNALGNGVADDKAIYCFVPEMIRYYLKEEPILPQIATHIAAEDMVCDHILANLHKLVIKMVNQSGGYGMVIGPQASRQQLEEVRQKILALPRSYIAQSLIELSTMPTLRHAQLSPHRVDLRVYVLAGKEQSWVLPGALTRVALKENSYVVNSSQGGGSKDTWVLK